MANTQETGETIVARSPVANIFVGDELLVFERSESDITVDLKTCVGQPGSMRLVSRIAITSYVEGIRGMARGGSYDTSYFMGAWRDAASTHAWVVQVREGREGIQTDAVDHNDDVRRHCRIFGWHVVAKVVKSPE